MKNEKNIKFEVFIKGDLVDLVVITEEIVKKTNWYKWFNDEETTKNMQKHFTGLVFSYLEKYLRNVQLCTIFAEL